MTRVDIWFCDLHAVAGRRMQVTEQAARDGLRRVLAQHLDLAPDDVRVVRASCPLCGGPHGRPELHPVHGGSDRLRFSMAHCVGLAVYAVADRAVGVDAEAITARVDRDDLRATLHPAEQRDGGSASRRDLLGCWVRKEAYLKGLGVGLGREPDTVHVGIPPDVPVEPRPVAGPDGWTLVDLPAGPDHVAAAAVEVVRCETSSPDSVIVRLHQLTRT